MKKLIVLSAALLLLNGCWAEKNDSAISAMQARIKKNNAVVQEEKPLKTILDDREQLYLRLDYARLLIRDNKIVKAEKLLDTLRKNEEIAPEVYPLLAEVYELQKKWKNAFIAWKQACKLDTKDNINFKARLARAALLNEKYDVAEQIYQQWLSSDGRQSGKLHITALNNLGFTCLLRKNYEQAGIYFNQALELDPLNKKAHANLSLLRELQSKKIKKVKVSPADLPLDNCYKKKVETSK